MKVEDAVSKIQNIGGSTQVVTVPNDQLLQHIVRKRSRFKRH